MMKLPRLLTPVRLLQALVATVGVAMAVIASVVVIYVGVLKSDSSTAFDTADATLAASQSGADLTRLRAMLDHRVSTYLASADVLELPEAQRSALAAELGRTDTGPPGSGTDSPLIAFSMAETIALQDAAAFLEPGSGLHSDEILGTAAGASGEAFVRYIEAPTPGNLRRLRVQTDALQGQLDERVTALYGEVLSNRSRVSNDTSEASLAVLGVLVICGLVVLVLGQRTLVVVHRAIAAGEREQMELAVTTTRLQFRNDQLNALYNVFTEITDTLSLEYVVNATLRESMAIMRADMATLRVLRGTELVPVGSMISTGEEIAGLRPAQLGVGPTGKAAKRGRTVRIEEGSESTMQASPGGSLPGQSPSEQTKRPPMESGMIVPLVVGARVVGTLACWSRNQHAFNDEDQRVLEMMASQVATAIAAAEVTEASQRQAHQDPLTSLPNRRQLDEDLSAALSELAQQGRDAVIAMLDIDNFKLLNDRYGHHTGDVALQRIAAVLRGSVRDNDHVYRFGGEEFVVIFTDTTIAEARPLAERLRSSVRAVQLTGEAGEPVGPTTVSIGLSLLPQHGGDVRALIDLADKAMYRAKSNGRDRIEVWSEDAVAVASAEAA